MRNILLLKLDDVASETLLVLLSRQATLQRPAPTPGPDHGPSPASWMMRPCPTHCALRRRRVDTLYSSLRDDVISRGSHTFLSSIRPTLYDASK